MVKRYKVICPLINLNIPNVLIGHPELSPEEVFREQEKKLVEGIDLFNGVKIRRISKEDLEDLKNSIFPLPLDTVVSPNMFVLEKYITTKDGHDFQLDQTMRNMILAMRLLKKGYVSGNAIFYILVSEKREFTSVEWSWEGGQRLEPLGFKYVFYFDEIPALKKKIEKTQGIDFAKQKRLHLACKRFQHAYDEDDLEDQLIDFMIAFEALFVRKEIAEASKREKIAIGCSDLLGKNEEEKEEIRSFLTKAYSTRNLIVHGVEYKIKDEYGMLEVVSKTEDYLRASLNKLLN